MQRLPERITRALNAAALLLLAGGAFAQGEEPDPLGRETTQVVVPQRGGLVLRPGAPALTVGAVTASVVIRGQLATTTLDVALTNAGHRPEEAVMLVPVPDGAVVRSFGYDGVGPEPTARLLPADEARRIYESIVRRMRDPGLLEFAGASLVRSSAFPVPPGATQHVFFTYDHVLPADGSRVDFVLPRSEAFASAAVRWSVDVSIESDAPVSTVYSPSHRVTSSGLGGRRVRVTSDPGAMVEPGPFRLSYLLEGAGLSATVLAHPDDSGVGGTFLLLGGLSLSALPGERPPREVTVVIDRSGSMRGEKLDQAREAALQVIEGLELGEWFHIVDYSDDVASFEPRPVQKTAETLAAAREYLASLRALGGTNIAGALELALSPVPSPGAVSVVLFLTDGLPTIGATDERDVRARVQRANAHGRRIFTFGVGYDVNAPLLDHVARASRATSHYVHPHQDLELAVAKVFRGLSGPVLSRPRLVALDGDGMPLARAVRDVLPGDLPDVFEGDQLVVLGRYEGARPIALFVEGDYLGRPRSFRVELDPARASRANAFVPRLWAARKIASLVDAIREAGAATGNAATDPRTRELVEEIVHLSTRYGVLSEYTAFLALEPDSAPAELVALGYAGDDFFLGTGEGGVSGRVLDRAEASLAPAATERAGAKAVRQAESLGEELDRRVVNRTNSFRDKDGNEVRVSAVQQVQDRTFYRRASGWVDGELLASRADFGIDSEVEFASDEYFAIAAQLAREGRQAALALGGDVLLTVGGKRVLLRAASPPTSGAR